MAVDTRYLLTILLIGVISGIIVDFVLGIYSARILSPRRSLIAVVPASVLVAFMPILAEHSNGAFPLWWKVLLGEAFLLLSFIDLGSKRVPNELILLFTVAGFVASFSGIGPSLQSAIYGVIFGTFFFLILALPWKGGLGMGDVKFAGMSGALIGFPAIFWALMSGLVAGGIVAAILLLTKKASRKDKLPYVPSLAAGIWLYMLIML